jgi:hypothetical protein
MRVSMKSVAFWSLCICQMLAIAILGSRQLANERMILDWHRRYSTLQLEIVALERARFDAIRDHKSEQLLILQLQAEVICLRNRNHD